MELETRALAFLPLVLASLAIFLQPAAANDGRPSPSGGFSLRLIPSAGWNSTMHVDGGGFLHLNEQAATTALRPHIHGPRGFTYSVATTVGTGRGRRTYDLVLDTASSMTWMRCLHCLPEQSQYGSVFDPGHSSSYHPLQSTSPLCRPPNPVHPAGHKCSFHLPTEAHGYVGVDTIILGNPTLPIHGIAFGCAQATEGFDTKGMFAGTLGMGRLPTSLIMQIKDRVAWRFSYCLIGPGHSQDRHGFIRFGADIPDPSPLVHHRIKILPTPPHLPHGVADSAYYVKLLGVSLNGSPIPGIHETMFQRRHDGSGGCFVDAGIQITHLTWAAYTLVEEAVAGVLQ